MAEEQNRYEEEFTMLRLKLENRRVYLGRMWDGDYGVMFKMLRPEREKGKRVRTIRLRLSEEAMEGVGVFVWCI